MIARWATASAAIHRAASAELAGGGVVSYALAPDAFEDDCRRAVLIVTTRDPPPDCAATVIGRDLWRRRGALALRREGSGFVIEAARPPNFDRPWAPAPRAAQSPVNGEADPSPAANHVPPRDATPRQEDIEADQ